MAAKLFLRTALTLALLGLLAPGAALAQAQAAPQGEARFKLSPLEQEQPASGQPAPAQAEPAQPAMDRQAAGQQTPDGQASAPGGQPSAQAASETGPAAQPAPDQAAADQRTPEPRPDDDLPPPMSAEDGPRPAPPATGAAPQPAGPAGRSAPRITAGKPLEIVPIREDDLANAGSQADKPSQAKPGKTAKTARPGQEKEPRPFWLDPRRPEADLRFKQGAAAFILGADIGRRGSFKTFYLDNPPRRVVDIPGRWRYAGPTNHPLSFNEVGSIRVGEHPDFLRIVFDYARGETRPPLVQTTPDGLSVIYFWGE